MRAFVGRHVLGGFLISLSLTTACAKQSPTQPNLNQPTPQPGTVPQSNLVDLRVDGATSLPPGESAQYTATARWADGTTRNVTAEAQWTSTDESAIAVNGGGLASGRSIGQGEVRASFGSLTGARAVIVVPAGTYLVHAFVSEDQVSAMIYGVKVEVISGPAAGLSATTDWSGSALLYGVSSDAELRFTKDGYDPIVQSIHVEHDWSNVWVQLLPSDGRLELAGTYTLTVNAASCTDGGALPDSVKTRTYSARIRNTGATVVVELDGASFALQWCPICHETRGNGFRGQPAARDARFTLDEYTAPDDWNNGIYPNVVESRPEGLLAISGHAIVAPTSRGFAGTLDGTIALYSSFNLTNDTSRPLASCRSSAHQFTLVR